MRIDRKRTVLPIACLVFLFSAMLMQPESTSAQVMDTINYSLKQKPRLFLNFVPFNSYISRDIANFTGIRAGLNFNKRIKFGIGYFGMTNSSVVSDVLIEDDGQSYITPGQLNFHFFSVTTEYIFYKNNPWQVSFIPVQFGVGRASYDYIRRSESARVKTSRETVLLLHPDFSAQYSVLNWLGIGATLGYRVSLNGSKNIQEDFNSPTFSLTLKVFIDELYKMAFPDGLRAGK